MNNIYNLSLTDLEEYFIGINEKKFKGQQVFDWLYRKKVKSFDEMTNLKKEVIDRLKEDFTINTISITKVERDLDVNKYLFRLKDDEKVEAVVEKKEVAEETPKAKATAKKATTKKETVKKEAAPKKTPAKKAAPKKEAVAASAVVAATNEQVMNEIVYQKSSQVLDREPEANETFGIGEAMPIYLF